MKKSTLMASIIPLLAVLMWSCQGRDSVSSDSEGIQALEPAAKPAPPVDVEVSITGEVFLPAGHPADTDGDQRIDARNRQVKKGFKFLNFGINDDENAWLDLTNIIENRLPAITGLSSIQIEECFGDGPFIFSSGGAGIREGRVGGGKPDESQFSMRFAFWGKGHGAASNDDIAYNFTMLGTLDLDGGDLEGNWLPGVFEQDNDIKINMDRWRLVPFTETLNNANEGLTCGMSADDPTPMDDFNATITVTNCQDGDCTGD